MEDFSHGPTLIDICRQLVDLGEKEWSKEDLEKRISELSVLMVTTQELLVKINGEEDTE